VQELSVPSQQLFGDRPAQLNSGDELVHIVAFSA